MVSYATDMAVAAGVPAEQLLGTMRSSLAISQQSCESCAAEGATSLAMIDPCVDLGGRMAVCRASLIVADSFSEVWGVLMTAGVLVDALVERQRFLEAGWLAGTRSEVQTTARYADVLPGRRVIYQRGVERIRQAVGDDGLAQLAAARAGATYDALVAFVRNLPADRQGALTGSPDS
jgi:hypothetical protein